METAYFIILAIIFVPILWYGVLLLFSSKKESISHPIYRGNVSIILASYNEENTIESKVLQLTEECKKLVAQYEIIVISDGSDDDTNSILQRLAKQYEIQYYVLPKRMGKASALNHGISKSKYPVLVFSDSRQVISENSLPNLLKHFSDTEIGAVSSMLIHEGQNSFIRKTINRLKTIESQIGSTVGVYGALYAVRKNCLSKLPPNTILDDLVISLFVLDKGKRVIMEPRAIVCDININHYYSKKRILRMASGLIQTLRENRKVLIRLSVNKLLFLYVQKYAKLSVSVSVIILTLLAFSSNRVLIFHLVTFGSLAMLLAIVNVRGLINLLRIFGIFIASVGSIKNHNTHLWEKDLPLPTKPKLHQNAL